MCMDARSHARGAPIGGRTRVIGVQIRPNRLKVTVDHADEGYRSSEPFLSDLSTLKNRPSVAFNNSKLSLRV
jgi:hypothetical protein